jgi:hypothetical protein
MTMSMSHQRYASIAGSAFRTLNSTQEELTRPEKFSKNANPIARRLALTRELLGLAEKEFAEWPGWL